MQGTLPDELGQRSPWKSEWKIGRCLRFSTGSCLWFALQTVRFHTGWVRFGSWIWTVPVRFPMFPVRFAVRGSVPEPHCWYLVQYLHFRILTFPLIWKPRLFMTFRWRISPNGSLITTDVEISGTTQGDQSIKLGSWSRKRVWHDSKSRYI